MSTSSFQKQFARFYAEELKKSFDASSGDSFLLFFGRSVEWGSTFGGDPQAGSDLSPPSNQNSLQERYGAWRNALGAKLVDAADVYHVFPRTDWTTATTYDQYDDSVDLFGSSKKFYVLTDELNVYKCISNYKDTPSTTKPTGTSTAIVTTEDGYKWKFMFKVTEDSKKFLTLEYIPCKFVTSKEENETLPQYNVQANAIAGAIEYVEITGSNEAYWPLVVLGVDDAGACVGDPTENDIDQANQELVQAITLDDINKKGKRWVKIKRSHNLGVNATPSYAAGGDGYGLFFPAGTGVGQLNQIVDQVAVDNGFLLQLHTRSVLTTDLISDVAATELLPRTEYNIMPYAVISGDGIDAQVRFECNVQGLMQRVILVDRGEDYKQAAVTLKTPAAGGEGGAVVTLPEFKVFLAPAEGHGANPIVDFNASRIMIVIKVDGEEDGDLIVGPDFRQYGLLKNATISKGGKSADGEYTNKIAGSEFSKTKYFELTRPYDLGDIAWRYSQEDETVTFKEADYIYGTESRATAKVKTWRQKSGSDSSGNEVGLLEVEDVVGEFDIPTGKVDEVRYVFDDDLGDVPLAGNETLVYVNDPVTQYGNTADDGSVDIITPSARGKVSAYNSTNNEIIIQLTSGSFGITGGIIVSEASGDRVDFDDATIRVFENKGGELLKSYTVDNNDKTSWRTYGDGGSTQDIARARNKTDFLSLYDRIPTYNLTHGCAIRNDNENFGLSTFMPGQNLIQHRRDSQITTATVAKWNYPAGGNTGELLLTNVFNDIEAVTDAGGGKISHSGGSTTDTNYIITDIEVPELNVGSGELLYIQNIRPITRTFEQQEEFKILLGF